MDPRLAGRAARSFEPLHALGYFAPEVDAEVSGVGVRQGRATYFASRSAPMGRVGAGPVAATFFVFNPSLVAHFIPAAWEAASPEDVVAARYRGVSAAYARLLGDEALASDEVREAADLARAATAGCTVAGRPLYAAHADLDWPDEPHLVLFHALTLLREHRGRRPRCRPHRRRPQRHRGTDHAHGHREGLHPAGRAGDARLVGRGVVRRRGRSGRAGPAVRGRRAHRRGSGPTKSSSAVPRRVPSRRGTPWARPAPSVSPSSANRWSSPR